MTVIIDDLALDVLLLSGTGPVSRHIQRYASTTILDLAKATISRPYPGGAAPSPGPPYRRSKDKVSPDLHDSLTVVSKPTPSGGWEYDIVPTAVKRGVNYGELLLRGGGKLKGPYRFLPDSYYL